MSDASLRARSPLEGLALPEGPRFALSEAPPAARFILRGGEAARLACGIVFGAEPPSSLGPAGEGAGRAALWLGPDEWLLIAEGADRRGARRGDGVGARRDRPQPGRRLASPDRPHRQRARPRRERSTPAARSTSTSRPFRSAWRRAPSSTRLRSYCGGAPRRRSMSKSGAPLRPTSRHRSPRPRAARRNGSADPRRASNPAPNPSTIIGVVLGECFAEARFLKGDHDPVHGGPGQHDQDQRPGFAEGERQAQIDDRQRHIHRIARPACAPPTTRCAGCPAGLSVVRRTTNRPAAARARTNPVAATAKPAQRTPPIVIHAGRHGMSQSSPMPARKLKAY